MPKIFYVYELRYLDSGKPFYVGKGTDDGSRKFVRSTRHDNRHSMLKNLITALKKRGEKPVIAIVYETDKEHEAYAEEKRLIGLYGRRIAGGILWNTHIGGLGGRAGLVTSEETKKKLSESQKGKPRPELIGRVLSAESRERIAASKRGQIYSIHHRAAISQSLLGRKLSDQHIAKLTGRVASLETISKLRHMRNTHEWRQRMSEIKSGRKLSAEHKKAISRSLMAARNGPIHFGKPSNACWKRSIIRILSVAFGGGHDTGSPKGEAS